jgi:hypothetical protein
VDLKRFRGLKETILNCLKLVGWLVWWLELDECCRPDGAESESR